MRNRALAALAVLPLLLAVASADIVHLKNGRKMEVASIDEKPDEIVCHLDTPGSGTITFPNDAVDWVELKDHNAALEEFAKRKKPGTAEALCDAARYGAFHGMKAEAKAAWEAALEKDAFCRDAHLALGHKLHDGKWMTDDEIQVATGHVKWEGKWVTLDEKSRIDAGWEFVDGKLLSPDDAKRAKGLVLHDGKWVPKKELDELEAKKAALEKEEKEAEAHRHDPKDDQALLAKFGDGWRVRAGKRYRLVTNVKAEPADFDDKLLATMDKFWDFYCDTFDVHPVQKVMHNIVCYNTQDEFNKAPGSITGAYGVYQHGDPWRPAVLWYMAGLRGSTFTSRHECGHQFVAHYVRQDGEAWFGEGIATTFECRGDVPFYDHLYRWEVVHKAVVDPGGFKLSDLVSGKRSDQSSIYCLGAAVHIFFLEGKEGAYRKLYQEWLKKGDTKSPEGLAKAMGQPLEKLQEEFVAWANELDKKRDPKIIEAGKTAPIPGK